MLGELFDRQSRYCNDDFIEIKVDFIEKKVGKMNYFFSLALAFWLWKIYGRPVSPPPPPLPVPTPLSRIGEVGFL